MIGIRSIGTGLAAPVAAVARGAGVRRQRAPRGHPFARRSPSSPRWAGAARRSRSPGADRATPSWTRGRGSREAPSAAWPTGWRTAGCAPAAIAFFPSHRGEPGPYAGERHRERWERCAPARRRIRGPLRLPGRAAGRWRAGWRPHGRGRRDRSQDLSAGRWRERLFPDRARWPAADVQGERRKYLLTAGGRTLAAQVRRARPLRPGEAGAGAELERAGLIPPVAGLRHGFLVGPWLEDARPLPLAPGVDRRALLDAVASYLAFRAARCPAAPRRRGATPERLLEMLRPQRGQALGRNSPRRPREWRGRLPEIARLERPVLTDNKLHAWEWLVTADGKHPQGRRPRPPPGKRPRGAAGHRLGPGGCRRRAGPRRGEPASVSPPLVARRAGLREPAPVQLAFYTLAYLAFQLGRHDPRRRGAGARADPGRERPACAREVERYAQRLRPDDRACGLGSGLGPSKSPLLPMRPEAGDLLQGLLVIAAEADRAVVHEDVGGGLAVGHLGDPAVEAVLGRARRGRRPPSGW